MFKLTLVCTHSYEYTETTFNMCNNAECYFLRLDCSDSGFVCVYSDFEDASVAKAIALTCVLCSTNNFERVRCLLN